MLRVVTAVPKNLFVARQLLIPTYELNHQIRNLHKTNNCCLSKKDDPTWWLAPSNFVKRNDEVLPPKLPHENPEPAWVCHERLQIRYSAKKMYYVAIMIRGLTVDEALKQLTFCKDKGAPIVKEILLEAQELAVKEHNVEFKSNLWVAESNVLQGKCVKGYRRHARGRFGIIKYNYCNYFVRLEEGPPPKFFYGPIPTGHEKLETWLQERRNRRISRSL